MLAFCQLSDPLNLWKKYKDSLSEDIMIKVAPVRPASAKRSGGDLGNRDYLRETNYDINALAQALSNNEGLLTDEQLAVYRQGLSSVESGAGHAFFLDALGGTGKTFLINLLLAKVRSDRGIVLAVASSGIAATLLEGGKTAHAAFKLPLNLMNVETPLCNISKQSNMVQVLRDCQLIVWDESTMSHKRGFEALSTTLKDIRGNDGLMGGVTVLLAGDFRQTLPVVPRGTRADEVKEKPMDWLCERAILTPKNDKAGVINDTLLNSFDGVEMEYRSVDSVVQTDDAVHYPVEFLNTLNPPGLPAHKLLLKVRAPVMLLRNLNPPKLCNGTRLRVKVLHRNVIEATVFTGCARRDSVLIPRIPLIPSEYPLHFKRLQFPLKVSFALTINKFQVLRGPGELIHSLVILAPKGRTTNVVYKEVLK
uniref:uncharacterized protein LOC117611500 n=1 Tax=Osmia lignaria TaxID=473952 RepID=UPI001478F54E|nr:uncharacterized protein LOC117611167 [Osmia lignaria]XP_034195335.1 uncharacterized protein LOC117611500 [Osmia lignaria]